MFKFVLFLVNELRNFENFGDLEGCKINIIGQLQFEKFIVKRNRLG